MQSLRSDDAEIFYEIRGTGPPVVLLHPFPCHHEFWYPLAAALESRYRLILPDLRGHGESEIGEGPALMRKHAEDIVRVLDAAGIGKAAFIGCSVGGYILFEFWRRFRDRVTSLALCDTRPQADTAEARASRLQGAASVLEQGTGPFLEAMNQVQRGMAERPDSVADLKTINVPTLIVIGEEDVLSTVADGELMRRNIAGSQLKVIPKAGHYAPWERPEEVGTILRQFLDDTFGKR
jgi:3-oxoadipate enol-lactonase